MKKSFIAMGVALALSGVSFGGNHHGPKDPVHHEGGSQSQGQGQAQGQGQSQNTVVGVVSNTTNEVNSQSAAASESRSSSEASSASAAQSGSTSASDSNSGGNVLNSSNVYKGVRNAPGIVSEAGVSTADCQGDWRVGASVPGGGVSFGKSRTIRDCVLSHAAAEELARGNLAASIKLRCLISVYREALGNECEALLNTQTEVRSTYVTKEELDKIIKKGLMK